MSNVAGLFNPVSLSGRERRQRAAGRGAGGRGVPERPICDQKSPRTVPVAVHTNGLCFGSAGAVPHVIFSPQGHACDSVRLWEQCTRRP